MSKIAGKMSQNTINPETITILESGFIFINNKYG